MYRHVVIIFAIAFGFAFEADAAKSRARSRVKSKDTSIERSAVFALGPAVTNMSSAVGYGANIDIWLRFSKKYPGYLDLDLSFLTFPVADQLGFQVAAIPMMAGYTHEFELALPSVRPYVSLVAGGAFYRVSGKLAYSTDVQPMALAKAGLNLGPVYIEPAGGVLKDRFIMRASVGTRLEI